jgi:hypothetical protein
MLAVPAIANAEEPHQKVQQALDWALPVNTCVQPFLRGKNTDSIDNANDQVTRYDLDHYEMDRFERKEKRWENCVEKYKAELNQDFETLKSSAQYGLTIDQKDVILGKMKLIQTALIAPNGIAET